VTLTNAANVNQLALETHIQDNSLLERWRRKVIVFQKQT